MNAITNLAPRLARRVRLQKRTADAAATDRKADEARRVIAEKPACQTAPNGTGARCTCDFDCANYWLRPRGFAPRNVASTPLPAPTFTALPPTLRQTAPIRITGRHAQVRPVLPVRTAGPAPATPRRPPADVANLRRVRDAIRDIPVDAPDPNLSRAEKFTADMRHTTGLPIFRRVARRRGWCGLNEEFPLATLSPLGAWRLEERERDLLNAIAAGEKTARIEVDGAVQALRRQIATEQGWRGTGMTA